MASTPSGTVYSVRSATVPGAGSTFWGIAESAVALPERSFVLYCHGAGDSADQFATMPAWAGLRNWIIDNGWGWVEGIGAGANAWGSPASMAAYEASLAHVAGLYDIKKVVVLGRSMGGLVGARIYWSRRGTDSRYKGFISNSGVQDLVWAYDWDGGRWTDAVNASWGVSSKAEFVAASAGMNRVAGPASRWTGANVLQLWGNADPLVPPQFNGEAMRTMYAGQPAVDWVDIRGGGDHSASNGSYTRVKPMTDFLLAVTGGTPPEPETGYGYRSKRRSIIIDGVRYTLRRRR